MSKNIDTILAPGLQTLWSSLFSRLLRQPVETASHRKSADAAPKHPGPAPAMLMASRDIAPLIVRTADRLADWQERQAGRQYLMGLDDRQLGDMGVTRCDAEKEYSKPFWRTYGD